jgi:uncharacterized membrane protein
MPTKYQSTADAVSHTLILLGCFVLMGLLYSMSKLTMVLAAVVITLIVIHAGLLLANVRILRYHKIKRNEEEIQ